MVSFDLSKIRPGLILEDRILINIYCRVGETLRVVYISMFISTGCDRQIAPPTGYGSYYKKYIE